MLAAHDQENLVHARQTAAAGKPLNQGVRQQHPKTPGPRAPKTPFKVPLNDENNPSVFNGGKTGALRGIGKGNENGIQTGKAGGKLDKNTVATPLGLQTRAPLGMKTTNAKTHAFQTPAVPATSKLAPKTNRKPSASHKKSRKTVAQAELAPTDILSQEDSDSDVPEPEYAPPNPTPLPDPPFDFGYDETFPQFQGPNLTRGFGAIYGERCDEEGVPLRAREEQKRFKEQIEVSDRQITAMYEAEKKEDMERLLSGTSDELDREVDEMIRQGEERRRKEQAAHQRKTGPSTVKCRSAASALNSSKAPVPMPSVKLANAAARPKPKFSVLGAKPKPTAQSSTTTTTPSSSTRSAPPLRATSRNTLGYSKGRNVSSNIRPSAAFSSSTTTSTRPPASLKQNAGLKPKPKSKLTLQPKPDPIDQRKISPWEFKELYGNPPMGSTMWFRMQDVGLFGEDVEGEDGGGGEDEMFDFGGGGGTGGLGLGLEEDEDGEGVFQLKVEELGIGG